MKLAPCEPCPCGCDKPSAARRFATDAEVLRAAAEALRSPRISAHSTAAACEAEAARLEADAGRGRDGEG